MKLSVIGGGGVRAPLLVHGLTRSDVPIDTISLYDVDEERLAIIGRLAQQLSEGARVEATTSLDGCLEGASFVFTSIRVGGIAARAHDEAVALNHGIVGQETVGPGGFAMAMRTIPEIVQYARAVERVAPDAWMINFTNPVGIITEAVRTASDAKIIGICDTPTELFEEIAHALGVPSSECHFDYFGLNHLGWVRDVLYRGRSILDPLFDNPEALQRLYRMPLFEPERLRQLRLVPTEYVYYYYRAEHAYNNVRRAGLSRGELIERLNRQLFKELAASPGNAIASYERYLEARDGSYMQIESGAAAPRQPNPWAGVTGYDKIALSVMRGIHKNTGAIVPLNVTNDGNISELLDTDVIEVPCVVNASGARALHSGPAAPAARDLLQRVKAYERKTVQAGLSRSLADARDALALNPLVPDIEVAGSLVEALDLRC
jgi:6-phospho-beta-glucosidase